MSENIIRDCWHLILQIDSSLLKDKLQPLDDIENYLPHFNLSPIRLVGIPKGIVLDIDPIEPSFKNLTNDILLWLRHHVYTKVELDTVAIWAEKLLRFCEVRYTTLKERSLKKWNDQAVVQLHLLHLSTFLLDYAVCTKDIRFLNTVLKLSDLKWIFNTKAIRKNLKRRHGDITSAIFQFRILLMTEYAMNQLRLGKKI